MNQTIETLLDKYVEQFNLNKHYINRYKNFIDKCIEVGVPQREITYSKHSHHIFPKSWSKRLGIPVINDSYNLIDLPYTHHVVAHHILAKSGDGMMKAALFTLVNWQDIDFDQFFTKGIRASILEQTYQMFIESTSRPVVNLTTKQTYSSIAYAAEQYNVSSTAIARACRMRHRVKKCYWQFEDIVKQTSIEQQLAICEQLTDERKQHWLEARAPIIESRQRAIVNVDTGEVFESITKASEKYNTSQSNISIAIANQAKSCGYFWAYKEDVDAIGREQLLEQLNALRVEKSQVRGKSQQRAVVNLNTGEQYPGLKAAAAAIGSTPGSMTNSLSKQRRCKQCYWEYQDKIEQSSLTVQQYLQKVLDTVALRYEKLGRIPKDQREVINLNTGEKYPTATDASRALGLSDTAVNSAILKHRRAGEYYWAFSKDVPDDQTRLQLAEQYRLQGIENQKKGQVFGTAAVRRPVVNLDTKQEFSSLLDAEKTLSSNVSISSAMMHRCRAGGYYWAYKDEVDKYGIDTLLKQYHREAEQNKRKDYLMKPVINLNTGELYESSKQVSEIYGTNTSSVTNTIKNKQQLKGYYFANVEELEQTGLTREQLLRQRKQHTAQQERIRISKHCQKVINIDTLQVYDSASDLERAHNKGTCTASAAIRGHRKFEGERWIWLDLYQQHGLHYCIDWFDKSKRDNW